MQISLGIKKYSLLLGVLFGGQQMQGMEMALQFMSTNTFLVGVMPDVFNRYVLNSPLVEKTVGPVSFLSFKSSALDIIHDKKVNAVEAWKVKFTESKIATLFYIARILGAGYDLLQTIRKDDDKMMGKKGLRLTAALLIEIKLLGELFG